ncbi:hypothetical protein GT755_12305 [Herbidospora sp. NEAU-GS84]|uniref:Uncharacterized protein n=1 Tax=Herbidospora solisilvae TaxID=2696284 RepID=A0A7C9JBI7_9ACTN|nr:hypothetical protein [Herbidospora solisilvae]NAS22464.1 hypothetical protein [Herbidospora solisilvae]
MPRTEARIFTTIWDDPDYLKLPPGPQRLYLFLISQPDLSYCGLIALRARRWAQKAPGLTPADVLEDLLVLAEGERPFVLVDEDTEEVLVRSLVRRDRVYKQPNVLKSARESASLIESPMLRAALRAELQRIPLADVGSDIARSVLTGFLGDLMEGSPNPSADPSDNPPAKPSRKGSRNPSPNPSGNPSQGKGEKYGEQESTSPSPSSPFPGTSSSATPSTDGDECSEEGAVQSDLSPELVAAIDRVCDHLANRVVDNGSKPPTISKRWRDAARLMLTADKRTEEQIHRAIDWCQDDEFWRGNILSLPTLRAKYDQLRLQASRPSRGSPRPAARGDSGPHLPAQDYSNVRL